MLSSGNMIYLFVYVNDLPASRKFYEEGLGLRVIEEDAVSVKYDTGEIILALNKAKDYGLDVGGGPDDTSIIVFHADDIDAIRAALERRGVQFSGSTDRYDIGATAMFYDLDGHCLCLYEPSEEALTWPSADKIRAIIGAKREVEGVDAIPGGTTSKSAGDVGGGLSLRDQKLLYLFLFVKDTDEARDFYGGTLGLRILEESPEAGVTKYDAGGLLLATHLVESEEGARATTEDLNRPKGIAPVFYVEDIDAVFERLSNETVKITTPPQQSGIGTIVKFEDPTGHIFYLYQPSDEALGWPSGSKIKKILGQAA